jgi:RNA polymerase sigma factor (sigma-70 family)
MKCLRKPFLQGGAIMVQEQIAHENPDELFCRAVAGDFKACDDLMRNFPGYVFRKHTAGDKHAVALLWHHFEPEAKRLAQTKTSNKLQARFDASEILSEVSLSLLKRRADPTQSELGQNEAVLDETPKKTIETYPQLKAWYMRIVGNRLIDEIRKQTNQKRTPERERQIDNAGCSSSIQRFEPRADESTVSQRAIRNEEMLRAQQAIENLPEGEEKIRSIYRLDKEGLSYAQISDQLGIGSISAVQVRIKKAEKMIEASLGIKNQRAYGR